MVAKVRQGSASSGHRRRRHTHIFALGGGRVRDAGAEPETTGIDRRIVEAAQVARPRLLFLPTASGDDLDYCAAIERHFGARLGCAVEHLLLLRARPSAARAEALLRRADIIYVGGGNTLRMLKLWRRLGIDRELQAARARGCVLSGLSAGAICWFRFGNSDSRRYSSPGDRTLIRVTGLGFVDLLICPHYDTERQRKRSVADMMARTPGCALGLENNTALEILDDRYRILSSREGKRAHRSYWHERRHHQEALSPHEDYRSLSLLTTRQPLPR